MNKKEFKQLSIEFVKTLSEKCKEKGIEVRCKQASNDTWLISLDSGFVGEPAEIFEMYNNGEVCKWRFLQRD